MSVTAIICEYNPFHNGHLYQMMCARELVSSSAMFCIMSGSMVQRGEPAILDKWARTSMALSCGADVVVELPVIYATGSARRFARGAIRLLKESGVITHLTFGTEAKKPELLLQLADILSFPPPSWDHDIKAGLIHGLSYATARLQATLNLVEKSGNNQLKVECEAIMSSPNNILALEYLIAINELAADIIPIPIVRQGEDYHSLIVNPMPSATLLRQMLRSGSPLTELSAMVPSPVLDIISDQISQGRGPVDPAAMETLLLYSLRTNTVQDIENLPDVELGMGSRILQAANQSGSLEQLRQKIKTKRYTMTRIDRILLYCLLYIARQDVTFFDSNSPNYLRVLGCSSSGQKILQKIGSKSELSLVNRVRPAMTKMQKSDHSTLKSFNLDLKATDLQALLFSNPDQRQSGQDFSRSPIIHSA